MAKIIYKEGCEGQNKLSCIEGIEIELLNGQKALIYPKYAERQMLESLQVSKWDVQVETEIEALKITDTTLATQQLFALGSPAALWVARFHETAKCRIFCLSSLLAALETQYQKKEIDALAETIEGADLLRNYYTSSVGSCSRSGENGCWGAYADGCYANFSFLYCSSLVVPTILYRDEN